MEVLDLLLARAVGPSGPAGAQGVEGPAGKDGGPNRYAEVSAGGVLQEDVPGCPVAANVQVRTYDASPNAYQDDEFRLILSNNQRDCHAPPPPGAAMGRGCRARR